MHDVKLTATERAVYDATDVRRGGMDRDAIAALGLTIDAYRTHRTRIRKKLGIAVTDRVSHGPHLQTWERDPCADETPREARARVALDLAEGRRCRGRMLSGAPCSLLLPCANHG